MERMDLPRPRPTLVHHHHHHHVLRPRRPHLFQSHHCDIRREEVRSASCAPRCVLQRAVRPAHAVSAEFRTRGLTSTSSLPCALRMPFCPQTWSGIHGTHSTQVTLGHRLRSWWSCVPSSLCRTTPALTPRARAIAVYKGTVNDPTTFPPSNRAHGSYHWAFERLLSAGLVPLTAAAFVTSGSAYPVLDGLLGISLVIHSHIGVRPILYLVVPSCVSSMLRTVGRSLPRTRLVSAHLDPSDFSLSTSQRILTHTIRSSCSLIRSSSTTCTSASSP